MHDFVSFFCMHLHSNRPTTIINNQPTIINETETETDRHTPTITNKGGKNHTDRQTDRPVSSTLKFAKLLMTLQTTTTKRCWATCRRTTRGVVDWLVKESNNTFEVNHLKAVANERTQLLCHCLKQKKSNDMSSKSSGNTHLPGNTKWSIQTNTNEVYKTTCIQV